MENNSVKKEGLLFVSDEQYNKLRTGKLQKNDFVFCLRGSLGKHCKYNYDTGAIASSLVILRKIGEILDDYISLYLDSPLITQEINSTNNGTAQPNLGARDVMEYLIPVPPLQEQCKIVKKIENLISNINQIEKSFGIINANKKILKAKIIDLAIKGKLTQQLSTDEPSSKLIEKIVDEKHKLMKEGKIKKENLSIIYKDADNQFYEKFDDGKSINITNSIPFKLPENWRWTRLNALLSVKGGKRIPKGSSFSKNITKHIYIRVSDMKNNTITKQDIKYISDDVFEKIKNYTISKKDLYLTIAGTIGKVGIVPDFFDNMNLTENAVKLTNIEPIEKKYLMYCINSDFVQSQFTDKTTQVAQPKLAIKRIETTLIPLPPLEEQKRMVFQLQQLLNIL